MKFQNWQGFDLKIDRCFDLEKKQGVRFADMHDKHLSAHTHDEDFWAFGDVLVECKHPNSLMHAFRK